MDWYFSRPFSVRILASTGAEGPWAAAGAGAGAWGAGGKGGTGMIVAPLPAAPGPLPPSPFVAAVTGTIVVVGTVVVAPAVVAAFALSAAITAGGRPSASITRRQDFERSWLRRSRTISSLARAASVLPLMQPATS